MKKLNTIKKKNSIIHNLHVYAQNIYALQPFKTMFNS